MTTRETGPTAAGESVLRCSFCQKAQDEVGKLIGGETALICDECVRAFTNIIRGEPESSPVAEEPPPPLRPDES